MTHRVIIEYQESDERIKLVLSTNPVIHEFQARQPMSDWLEANCSPWPKYHTIHKEVGNLGYLYAMAFDFEDPHQAMLFKLTWGGV